MHLNDLQKQLKKGDRMSKCSCDCKEKLEKLKEEYVGIVNKANEINIIKTKLEGAIEIVSSMVAKPSEKKSNSK